MPLKLPTYELTTPDQSTWSVRIVINYHLLFLLVKFKKGGGGLINFLPLKKGGGGGIWEGVLYRGFVV